MTSLLTFLLTINIANKILIPVFGSEHYSMISQAETVGVLDPFFQTSPIPEVIDSEPWKEHIELDISSTNFITDNYLSIQIKYSSVECRYLLISAYYQDYFLLEKEFYQKEILVNCSNNNNNNNNNNNKDNEPVVMQVIKLPDSIVYNDEQNTKEPTNFYVSSITVHASFVAVTQEEFSNPISANEVIPLLSPWFRKPRPRYCANWELYLRNLLKWKYIPTTPLPYDSSLFSSIVAFPANEIGFTRQLKPPIWPSYVPQHVKDASARFTVTLWIFITKACPHGLCMILQHRNSSSYYTPLILLNSKGGFHIQLHMADGVGSAFTSIDEVPLKRWIFIVLVLDDHRAELKLYFEDRSPLHFVHIGQELQAPYHFNETEGLWVIGGYYGSVGFSGYLGPVNLYRNIKINFDHALKFSYEMREKLIQLNLSKKLETCDSLKVPVYKYVLGLSFGYCPVRKLWHKPKPPVCPFVKKSVNKVLTSHLLRYLRAALKQNSTIGTVYSLQEYANILFESTMKNLEKRALANSVSARLFEVSGCLGYPKGYYVSATMHKYGIGIKVDLRKTLQMHLIAAEGNYALAHLALAYRHQLGIDGSSQDVSIMTGYLRQAAITAKVIMETEKQKVVTQSEMIRLDQVHLFRDVRGSESELLKWLGQQAKMGSVDANNKMAEILYHGRQGVNVDRDEARGFFERAAAEGDVAALYNLGVIHLKGIKVKKNKTKAFEFFKKAAEYNNSIAFNSMAFVEFVHNNNRSGAIHYWKKAADLDDGDGLNNYATILEAGLVEGKNPNKKEAYDFYVKAAGKGQKNGCIKVGDYMIEGVYTDRDVLKAAQFYRYVADQLDDVGLCLQGAINAYANGEWYMSLFHHLLVNEAGIQLGGYNTALLLRQYQGYVEDVVNISDPYYFYNLTAEQGWSLSMIEMGHRNWYGESGKKNLKKASQYYARSIEKDNNPEALYNLGYIIEHGYPIDEGIKMTKVEAVSTMHRNLSLASYLYQSCIDTETENKEGFYPCKVALLRTKLKIYIKENLNVGYWSAAALSILFMSIFTYIKIRRDEE